MILPLTEPTDSFDKMAVMSLHPAGALGIPQFLLIGVGPHAKRTYIPHLNTLKGEGRASLVAAVDLESNGQAVTEYTQNACPHVQLLLVPPFSQNMPLSVESQLNDLVAREQISCVVISTEPLAHKVYGLWAISQGLNVIMDKPISTRSSTCTDFGAAAGIAEDFDDLHFAYQELQQRKTTFFLINSHRRYHPGFYCTFDMIKEIQQKTGCPVTNIISTHCDGMWRLPTEIVEQKYHSFNAGYGKVSHSGYHFLDQVYNFMKAGWTEAKRPDVVEVVSSFLLPNGFLTCLTKSDHERVFGAEQYAKYSKYSDEELRKIMPPMGEIDASIQLTFYRNGDAIALAQINLQHTGFSRRSWLEPGVDLYKGIGRVKHEAHEIRSGPYQTVVIDSRQANDKHDRSLPSTAKLGSDNHFEVHTFRNCDLLGEDKPLQTFTVADLDRRYNTLLPGIYSENVKRGILWEAVDFLTGGKTIGEMTSNLPDHSLPAHIMSAIYISHIRRMQGLSPVVPIDVSYSKGQDVAQASLRKESYAPVDSAKQNGHQVAESLSDTCSDNTSVRTAAYTSTPARERCHLMEAAKISLDNAKASLTELESSLSNMVPAVNGEDPPPISKQPSVKPLHTNGLPSGPQPVTNGHHLSTKTWNRAKAPTNGGSYDNFTGGKIDIDFTQGPDTSLYAAE